MGKRCGRGRRARKNGAEAEIEKAVMGKDLGRETGKGRNQGTEKGQGPATERGRAQEIAKTALDQGTEEGQGPVTGAIAGDQGPGPGTGKGPGTGGGRGPSQGTGTGAGAGAESAREQCVCTGKINVNGKSVGFLVN